MFDFSEDFQVFFTVFGLHSTSGWQQVTESTADDSNFYAAFRLDLGSTSNRLTDWLAMRA